MARVTVPSSLSNIESTKDLQRFLSAFVSQIVQQFNGNIQFNQNIKSSPVTNVVFANSSDVQTVPHSFGRIPVGFLVVNQTAPGSIYSPAGASYLWTNANIYLQSSAGMTATIFII